MIAEHRLNRVCVTCGSCFLEPKICRQNFDTRPQLFAPAGQEFVYDGTSDNEGLTCTAVDIFFNGSHDGEERHDLGRR